MALDLADKDFAKRAGMERLQGVQLRRALAEASLEPRAAHLGVLDRGARRLILDALIVSQDDRLQLHVQIGVGLPDEELDLAGRSDRHALPSRVEVADIDDPHRAAAIGRRSVDQLAAPGHADLTHGGLQVQPIGVRERLKDLVNRRLLGPDFDVVWRRPFDIKADVRARDSVGKRGKLHRKIGGISRNARRATGAGSRTSGSGFFRSTKSRGSTSPA